MNETVLENNRDSAVDKVVSRAKETIQRAKQPVDSTETSKEFKDETQKQNAKLAKALDKLYSPDNFAPLVRAPADIMLAISGDSLWNMSDKEVAVLSASAANCARYFLEADPKWIALTIFATAIITSYGSRTAVYLRKKGKSDAKDK